jgi:hypothetical protein
MFNFFVKVVRDFCVFFLYWKEARGACVLWRTTEAPAYPVWYARYGRMHTGNLPTLGREPPTIGRRFLVSLTDPVAMQCIHYAPQCDTSSQNTTAV